MLNNSDENGYAYLVLDLRKDQSKMTQTDGEIYHVLGLEETIL